MTMENTKKLSLKRKSTLKKNFKELKVDDICVSTSHNNAEKQNVRNLSTLSAEDSCQHTQLQEMKTDRTTEGKRRFLDVSDPALLQLRKLILRSTSSASSKCFTPLPPQSDSQVESNGSCGHNSHNQDRLPVQSKPQGSEELSPFPAMCDWCRRRSPLNHQTFSDTIRMLCKSGGSSSGCLNTGKDDIHDSCLETFHQHIQNDTSLGNCSRQDLSRLRSNNEPLAAHVNDKSGSRIDNLGQEQEILPLGRVVPTPSVSCDVNNSHLMRDRNSNFYSMQSSNVSTQNMSVSQGVTKKRRRSTDDDPTECQNQNENQSKPCNVSKKHKLEVHTGNNTDLPSRKQAMVNTKSSNGLYLEASGSKIKLTVTAQEKTSSGKDIIQDKQVNATASSHVSQKQSTSDESPSADSVKASSFRSDPGTEPVCSTSVAVKDTSPSVSCPRKELPLQQCPLCQLQFQQGAQQMEIDSHIAQCLAAADDDVMW